MEVFFYNTPPLPRMPEPHTACGYASVWRVFPPFLPSLRAPTSHVVVVTVTVVAAGVAVAKETAAGWQRQAGSGNTSKIGGKIGGKSRGSGDIFGGEKGGEKGSSGGKQR